MSNYILNGSSGSCLSPAIVNDWLMIFWNSFMKQKLRALKVYEFKQGWKAAEAIGNICAVLGQEAVKEKPRRRWFQPSAEFRRFYFLVTQEWFGAIGVPFWTIMLDPTFHVSLSRKSAVWNGLSCFTRLLALTLLHQSSTSSGRWRETFNTSV